MKKRAHRNHPLLGINIKIDSAPSQDIGTINQHGCMYRLSWRQVFQDRVTSETYKKSSFTAFSWSHTAGITKIPIAHLQTTYAAENANSPNSIMVRIFIRKPPCGKP